MFLSILRKRNIDVKETLIGCLPCAPGLGIELATEVRALTENGAHTFLVCGMVRQPSHLARADNEHLLNMESFVQKQGLFFC